MINLTQEVGSASYASVFCKILSSVSPVSYHFLLLFLILTSTSELVN